MDIGNLDRYLINQINESTAICSLIVAALKEDKIDKTYALDVLDKAKTIAVKSYDQRCSLFDENKLNYSNIESAKRSFINGLDNEVYSIINQMDEGNKNTL